MNCSECNEKNAKSAKFCKNCGNKLVKEEVEVKNVFNEFKELIINLFKKPNDTLKDNVKEESYQNAIVFLAMNILAFTLLLLIIMNIMHSSISSIFYYLGGSFDFGMYSYFRIFLLSIIFGVLNYVIFGGVYYLVSKYLFKSNIDIKSVISWLGINSIVTLLMYVILIITIFISAKISLIILFIGVMLYMYNLYSSAKYIKNSNENYIGYGLVITMFITLLLMVYVLPQLFI